jgi:hypothetical protein
MEPYSRCRYILPLLGSSRARSVQQARFKGEGTLIQDVRIEGSNFHGCYWGVNSREAARRTTAHSTTLTNAASTSHHHRSSIQNCSRRARRADVVSIIHFDIEHGEGGGGGKALEHRHRPRCRWQWLQLRPMWKVGIQYSVLVVSSHHARNFNLDERRMAVQ